ncbi:hypothetical protein ACC732_36555, partial [Rhizobium ruizarguesonis]
WKFKRFPMFAAIFLSLAAALILLSGSYRLFGSYLQRDEAFENPTYIGRLSIAFWSTLIRTLALPASSSTETEISVRLSSVSANSR